MGCLENFLWLILDGVAAQDIELDIVPDTNSPSVSTHVCKSMVNKIGKNLPCIKASAQSYLTDYSVYNTTMSGNTLVFSILII